MSNIANLEEQPPESPLDVLSRVATMVEKSQTSPAASAVLQAAKATEQSTGNLNTYTSSIGTHHNDINSTQSPPQVSEEHNNSQNKSKVF